MLAVEVTDMMAFVRFRLQFLAEVDQLLLIKIYRFYRYFYFNFYVVHVSIDFNEIFSMYIIDKINL